MLTRFEIHLPQYAAKYMLASVRSPTSAYRTLHGAQPVGQWSTIIPNMVMSFKTLRDFQFDGLRPSK